MNPEKQRVTIVTTIRVALTVAGASLVYLLFVFGHTETASPNRILFAAALCGVSALVAGLLQWVGLPATSGEGAGKKKSRRRSTSPR